MYTVSKPDGTKTIHFEDDELQTLENYARWQGVEVNFFLTLAIQTTIRSICLLFPKKLTMPGALDREMFKHEQHMESLKVNHG